MADVVSPIPPDEIRVGKRSTYEQMGPEFVELLERRCGLRPDSDVLEVGCGTGRVARAVAPRVAEAGSYEGFDIVGSSVEWCRAEIAARLENVRFFHSDVYNSHYNPEGKTSASAFRFPYPDECFDVVYLTSIFTHMLPAEVENYLTEIARTLRRGGSYLSTWFLLNDESESLIQSGAAETNRRFPYRRDGYRTISTQWPERAVAFEQAAVVGMHEQAGLSIVEPIEYGWWCGRALRHPTSGEAGDAPPSRYQDIIVATKLDERTEGPARKS